MGGVAESNLCNFSCFTPDSIHYHGDSISIVPAVGVHSMRASFIYLRDGELRGDDSL